MLDVSSRGLGLTAAPPPAPGSYVEIRRGVHIIVARVVWTEGLRFGVQTQDPIQIDALIRDPGSPGGPSAVAAASELQVERRRTPRPVSDQHDRSRFLGRALEFVFLGILGASAAILGAGLIKEVFGSPLDEVQKALVR
jgi:hypothetical protein